MEENIFKCSSKEHNDINAIKFCQECKVYLCNKCNKFHSELFNKHRSYSLGKDPKELFIGLCKIENHKDSLEYFCRTHNELCCVRCIAKIKSKGNGQHSDCDICNIEDILDEKEKNLEKNIKSLEELSKIVESSIKELNEIIEQIDKNKEEIKLNIQKTFTKIRNELNNREDQLLLEVDNKFQKQLNAENFDLLKEKDKLPNKIKHCIEKGKTSKEEFSKNNNKPALINACLNIEKMIDILNRINQDKNKYKSNKRIINFISTENEIIKLIKKFGSIYSDENKINQQEININIDNFIPNNLKLIQKANIKIGMGNTYVYDSICIFHSQDKEHVLGYIDANSQNKSIIFYNIIKLNEIKRINNAHNKTIHCIKYYDYYLYDLILSSSYNDDIKIWNYNNCDNILTISQIFNETNGVFSSCIVLNENNENLLHIFCVGEYDYIKIYDSTGNFFKNIGKNDERRRDIDLFKLNEKKYIVSGSNRGITVFNYPDLTDYHRFLENNDTSYHNCAKIIKANDIYNLIDVGSFNSIKIWNFFNKTLIANILSNNQSGLGGFASINNRYLLIGSLDGTIKEFDIQKKVYVKSFEKQHSSTVIGIKIIKNENGKNLVASYGTDNKLILWEIE